MGTDDMVKKLRTYMTLEQDFALRRFQDSLKELETEDVAEALSIVYANYLIRGALLENIIKWCITNDVDLPCFGDLIRM